MYLRHKIRKKDGRVHRYWCLVLRIIGPAVALTAFALAWVGGGAAFPTDDAYINLHNAQVLWNGVDEAYKGTPALVGATSGVHLALLMLLELVIRPDALALFVLGAVIAVIYVLGLFEACANVGCTRLEAMLVSLGGLVLGGSIFQLLNGMDTGLAMAAVAWNLKLLTDRKRTFWLPALCGLMPFIRPELSFLSVGSMLILLCGRESSNGFKVASAILSILVTVPFVLWYWTDTGSPIPSTVGAKEYFFAGRYLGWATKIALNGKIIGLALLVSFPLFVCVRFVRPRALCLMLVSFGVVFVGVHTWRFPGGLVHNGGRYLFPFVPIVLFGVACGLASASRRRVLAYSAASLLLVPVGLMAQFRAYETLLSGARESAADTVRWMNANLPEGATVMVHDAGYVAYAARFPLIDLVGLKTPRASEMHRALTYPSDGKLRPDAIAKIATEFHPHYFMVWQEWDDLFHLVAGLRAKGWTAQELHAGRTESEVPDGQVYRLYQLDAPSEATMDNQSSANSASP